MELVIITMLLWLVAASTIIIHQLRRIIVANEQQAQRLLQAVETAKADLIANVQTAVAAETQQVLDALTNLPEGQALSEEQLQAIETAVRGMGQGVVEAIGGVYEPPAPPPPPTT